ncbi:6-phosphofructokinase [Enhygromyxa salina]|uniref:ATP-dependent 6-phosphofructokinase n=1 Tax=Enhygromyxa salina TaxID=215803 RepID=A0A2S9YD46_9BACT|nr:ATP-dependent 6-phosphofructokinase [Enhygromyxa salina]PRQ03034.1 6-phosphofructokinase [Enhygromyxa salina]
MQGQPKAIAVLTSGGDAAGMNMAIRAVTRSALARGWAVYGVQEGFAGLIAPPEEGKISRLEARDVGGILGRGGTVLGSARCKDFHDEKARARGIDNLAALGVDALVVIGGNGSQTGAHALHEQGLAVIGIASTIDNDLEGSDITLGADTALNVAVDAVDKLRVTASSHRRASIVEVMGRHCGYIGLAVGLATGAEAIVLPENDVSPDEVAQRIVNAYERGKHHAIVIVAEGARHNAQALAAILERDHRERVRFDMRVTVLGHIQRGGTPTVQDRLLGARFGAHAIECLARGEHGVLVGLRGSEVVTTPLAEVIGKQKPLDLDLVELAHVLAQ